jgi:hypothetical protein
MSVPSSNSQGIGCAHTLRGGIGVREYSSVART